MSETPSPLFNIFSNKDVGGLIIRKLRGKDLSMFHERKWFSKCIPLMRLEMTEFFTTVQNPSVVPDEKIPLMYKIYYGSRRNLETGIILISLQVPDPFFTQYFIDYLATKLNSFSRHDVQDNMWETPELTSYKVIVNKKVIRKAAELDKLDWILYSRIYPNILAVMFGYAKGGHIHRINSFFNMYKDDIIHIKKDNLISIMTGAAAGGHFDILGKFYLKYLEEFGRNPDLTKILSYAARGGHVEIFEKYSEMLETHEMDVTEHLQYYAAQGNNMHFIKDSLVKNDTGIIKGYIKGGHINCLPSPLVYKYTADHFRTSVIYGRVDILRKIWNDSWTDRFLYNDWLDEYEEIWADLQEFGEEIRTKQARIRKELKKKYGKDFVNSHEEIRWFQVQKDMEIADGNLDQALLFALRRSDLTHIAFYYDKGATNKQEAIQEAKNMRNREFAMEDLARIFEEIHIYEDEILDNIFEEIEEIWE